MLCFTVWNNFTTLDVKTLFKIAVSKIFQEVLYADDNLYNHPISLPKVLGLPRLFPFDRTRIKVLDWNMRNAYKWLQTQLYDSFNTNIGRMKFCNGTVMQTTGKSWSCAGRKAPNLEHHANFETPWYFLEQNELQQKLEITSLQLRYH